MRLQSLVATVSKKSEASLTKTRFMLSQKKPSTVSNYFKELMYDIHRSFSFSSCCFVDRYTSGLVCTFIHVEKEPLKPVPKKSYPSENQQVYAEEKWIVRFNKKVVSLKTDMI